MGQCHGIIQEGLGHSEGPADAPHGGRDPRRDGQDVCRHGGQARRQGQHQQGHSHVRKCGPKEGSGRTPKRP